MPRKTMYFAAAALLTLSAPVFAQSSVPETAVRNGMANEGADMNEGRAAKDEGADAANAARRGTERNGNENGNNMTRSNGS